MKRADNLFRTILKQDGSKGFMAYAQSYARAGIGMEGEMLAIQVSYVLNNIQYWRGDVARSTKTHLKAIVKWLG